MLIELCPNGGMMKTRGNWLIEKIFFLSQIWQITAAQFTLAE
jgi:hypothetical protein